MPVHNEVQFASLFEPHKNEQSARVGELCVSDAINLLVSDQFTGGCATFGSFLWEVWCVLACRLNCVLVYVVPEAK